MRINERIKLRTEEIRLKEFCNVKGTTAESEIVLRLIEAMKQDGQLRPVLVERDASGEYWLLNGFARYYAAQRLGIALECEISRFSKPETGELS